MIFNAKPQNREGAEICNELFLIFFASLRLRDFALN